MIRMRFDEAEGLPASNFDTLRVGFKTRRKQGLLMQIVDENGSDYVSLAMNNNGKTFCYLLLSSAKVGTVV